MTPVEIVNQTLTLLVILAQVVIVLLFFSFFFPKKQKDFVFTFFKKNSIIFAFVISLTATLGSLFYSEIAGYEPCKLCWFQRIFMYPLPILLAVSMWKKDNGVVKYALALSVVGGLIALLHYLLQVGIVPNGACGVVGYSVSCSQRFVMEFGYITIPMMSLTAFVYIIAILLTSFYNSRRNKK